MKKVFLYIVMVMACAACGGGGDNGGGDEPVVVTNDYIGVQPSSIQMSGSETVQELTITANCNWSVSADVVILIGFRSLLLLVMEMVRSR